MAVATETPARRRVMLITVVDEPGILARIVGLFSGRGWNIDDLTVARVTSAEFADVNGGVSRITIVTETSDEQNTHIVALIQKIVAVLQVKDVTDDPDKVEADVTFVKVLTSDVHLQTEIAVMADTQFRAMSIRTRPDFIVLRFVGQARASTDFVAAVMRFGVEVETVRSGIIAIA